MIIRWKWLVDFPRAIATKSVGRDPNVSFQDDPEGFGPPKDVTRKVRAREKTAMAIPEHYSDELLEQDEERMVSRGCAYYHSLKNEPESANETSKTIHIPRTQRFNVGSLENLMALASKVRQK